MSKADLELRTFEVDVTPPVGDWLCGGFHGRSAALESRLLLRGIVLSRGNDRFVVAVIDYCYLIDRSQRRLELALAEGAGVDPSHVVVQSNHTHAAPMVAEQVHAIVQQHVPDLRLHNEDYFADVLSKARDAVISALMRAGRDVMGISHSSHAVDSFASSRRVLDEANQCHIRWSVCADATVRDKPVGTIDPLLSQMNLHGDDGRIIASLNFFACHPQTADRRTPELISRDTLGVALDLFEKAHPGIFALQFDGCGGDITAGKYTTQHLDRNRFVFGVRLFDAMHEAIEKARMRGADDLRWIDRTFEAPLSRLFEGETHFLSQLHDKSVSVSHKVLAAWKLHRLNRRSETYPFRATRLMVGDVQALFLPAELCVEYQLFAKARCGGDLCVAAYGDSFLNYVGTDEMFEQGGYEVRPIWTEVGPGIEGAIKQHIEAVLRA